MTIPLGITIVAIGLMILIAWLLYAVEKADTPAVKTVTFAVSRILVPVTSGIVMGQGILVLMGHYG